MEEQRKQAAALQPEINQALERLHITDLSQQLEELKTASQRPDFWDDSGKAQDVMKRIAMLEVRVQPWQKLHKSITDITELLQLDDASLEFELKQQLAETSQQFDALKEELKFNGPYDDHDAILTLSAGAGGTDAQDWTQMLLRMYVRWAENNRYKVTTVEESPGEEAGLKSVTLEISGPFVYGKLQGEHGVHRLVRLSPFNSDNLRQTSFAKVEVMPKIDQPDDLAIDDKDLKVDVYRSGGHGGQSVNTTDSAVRVTHLPTGITVAIQNERSQLQNKETAMTILRSKLAQLQMEQHAEKLSELKGPNQSAEWGNQIRSYVLHPYKQVKELRTRYETSDPDAVLDGHLDPLINAYLEYNLAS
ncbi:MAG TPA: peptide chain release factor 2 [Verrucomicrobiae bacterium]|jgi:peptide chain release factor 2|nr:peptide chain release factor 2 [Verrucomicrobiae bacterium]